MLKKVIRILCCFLFLIFLSLGHSFFYQPWKPTPLQAAEECTCPSDQDELTCNKTKQACWQQKIDDKQHAANTLSSVISVLNGQIVVQELQISQTKLEIEKLVTEIQALNQRISGLNTSLDRLTSVLIERVGASYKRRHTNPMVILLISDSLNSFFSKYKYLQVTQEHTTELMKQAESQKIQFDEQKALKEKKQEEVDAKKEQLLQQQNTLTRQRAEQQVLLQQTKNDEARYQAELAKTLAEQAALSSIIAGNGNETKVGEVKEGDTIASIISGASTCSNGTHLHFEVVKDGGHRDPSQYLKPISLIWNNGPDEAFGFGGDWNWPLNDPARINQGYGMTYYARVRRAYGGGPHTGIDMMSKNGDFTVKAVKEGTLYRGSISCGKGLLRYVKVVHKDSNLSSYYLHINY